MSPEVLLSPAPGRCDHSKRSLVQTVKKGDAAVWGQRFQLDNSLSASLLSGTLDTSCTLFHAASSSFSMDILQPEIQLQVVPQFHCTTSSSDRRDDSFFHRPLCGFCSPAPVFVAGLPRTPAAQDWTSSSHLVCKLSQVAPFLHLSSKIITLCGVLRDRKSQPIVFTPKALMYPLYVGDT